MERVGEAARAGAEPCAIRRPSRSRDPPLTPAALHFLDLQQGSCRLPRAKHTDFAHVGSCALLTAITTTSMGLETTSQSHGIVGTSGGGRLQILESTQEKDHQTAYRNQRPMSKIHQKTAKQPRAQIQETGMP